MKENDLFLDRYLSKIVEDFEGWAERSSKSVNKEWYTDPAPCLLYTSPSPRD